MPRKKRHPGWPKPAPELVRFVRALAEADARRDHAEALKMAAAKAEEARKRADGQEGKPFDNPGK
ncbi:hypothetical protein Q8W71_07380 [Methylobacterium sp. NEAU 140]|uniref:hypothetical protein n=1 Tax=Methylobacterium sp. NEAU 140 TaxID=3064945 RepID=UPI00273374C3|nr:hypothetical protein [Methylobacterium sp. NEAU 140]MDP4022439.1 hypothetical protein [Methylobacterium sp. NEAU 140]